MATFEISDTSLYMSGNLSKLFRYFCANFCHKLFTVFQNFLQKKSENYIKKFLPSEDLYVNTADVIFCCPAFNARTVTS